MAEEIEKNLGINCREVLAATRRPRSTTSTITTTSPATSNSEAGNSGNSGNFNQDMVIDLSIGTSAHGDDHNRPIGIGIGDEEKLKKLGMENSKNQNPQQQQYPDWLDPTKQPIVLYAMGIVFITLAVGFLFYFICQRIRNSGSYAPANASSKANIVTARYDEIYGRGRELRDASPPPPPTQQEKRITEEHQEEEEKRNQQNEEEEGERSPFMGSRTRL